MRTGTKNILEGNWNELRGLVQRQWGKITDDDLHQINGSRTQLLGVLQKNYGMAENEAEEQVKTWEKQIFH